MIESLISWVTRTSLRIKWVVIALAVLVMVAGVFAIGQFKQELIPAVEFPQTVVLAFNNGMEAEDMLSLRPKLLDVHGIGPETADSILLYALEKPVFVQMRSEVGKTAEIINKLSSFDYVMEVYQVLGEFNILGKIMIPNIEFAEKFIKDLSKIDGLAEKTIRRAGKDILGILSEATHDASGYLPPARPDEQQKKALKEVQRLVTACAEKHDIAAELLAPKKELSAAMLGERESRVFNGWRRDLIGGDILELLENV